MINIKAPGRICLFGEHQDYLDYPTISMAISKYIYLEARRIKENKFLIRLPDINNEMEIPLDNKELEYVSEIDYLRSGYNQFIRKKIEFNKGYDILITGDIPMNSGAASSSALVVAWLYFLNIISDRRLDKYELTLESYDTEVKEFGGAGGKMDFFSSIYGYIPYINPRNDNPYLREYEIRFEGFILGDSHEKKNTINDLKKVKKVAVEGFKILEHIMPNFNKYTTPIIEVQEYLESIDKNHRKKIIGNLINRDITIQAKTLLDKYEGIFKESKNSKNLTQFYKKLGFLINEHQKQLKDNIEISTVKIDNMIINCLNEGALGAKINGSGFGGTMFAFGLDKKEALKNVIELSGGTAYEIQTSTGVETF